MANTDFNCGDAVTYRQGSTRCTGTVISTKGSKVRVHLGTGRRVWVAASALAHGGELEPLPAKLFKPGVTYRGS